MKLFLSLDSEKMISVNTLEVVVRKGGSYDFIVVVNFVLIP